jgi:hypothetical protein
MVFLANLDNRIVDAVDSLGTYLQRRGFHYIDLSVTVGASVFLISAMGLCMFMSNSLQRTILLVLFACLVVWVATGMWSKMMEAKKNWNMAQIARFSRSALNLRRVMQPVRIAFVCIYSRIACGEEETRRTRPFRPATRNRPNSLGGYPTSRKPFSG